MPPLPVIADVYRVVLKSQATSVLGGQTAVNVMHFKAPGKTPTDVFNAFDTNVTLNMWQMQSPAWRVFEMDVQALDGTDPQHTFSPANVTKWNGATTGEIVPQTCSLIKLTTGVRGKSYQGRIYLPWASEGAQNAGQFTASLVTTCTNAWVQFANNMATAGVALGVASYRLAVWEQALAVKCENAVATQRRRLVR